MTYTSTHRGYTLLFATLTAAVVLNIAIFISSVSRKQYILSSTARDSLFAVYNADSAIDCVASYWLDGATADGFLLEGKFRCDSPVRSYNINIPITPLPDNWEKGLRSDEIVISFGNGPNKRGCAKVTLIQGTRIGGGSINIVEALGYNLGEGNNKCPTVSPRTVERALRRTYQ